jgi:hypothetical protein
MKVLPLLAITPFLFFSCREAEEKGSGDMEAEKKAIMQTIAQESNAFFTRDYNAWKNTYAQTDFDFQAWSNSDGTFDSNVGWSDIDKTIGKYISENPDVSHPKIERKNVKFKFYGDDAAYLTWDQFNSDANQKFFYHSKEVRVMEKIDGEWKIVCVSAFWDYKNQVSADSLPNIQKMPDENRGKDKI